MNRADGRPRSRQIHFHEEALRSFRRTGFLPIRVPLQHLRVDMDLFDDIRDIIVRFGGRQGTACDAELFREKVYSESVSASTRDVSPYIFIFDGWDEINLAADEGFQKRVDRLLESIRRNLTDQNRNIVRVIISGRPSTAIARSGFLRDQTKILLICPIRPSVLRDYVRRLEYALNNPRFSGPRIENWRLEPIERYEPVLSRYEEEFPEVSTLEVLNQPLLAHLAMRVMANLQGDIGGVISSPTTLYRHLTDLTCKRAGKDPTPLRRQNT